MGYAYEVVCERCGKRVELAWGLSYAFGWGNPELIGWIKDGKYGKKAKEAYESHENALSCLDNHPFICGCGYLKTYSNLTVMSNDLSGPEIYFRTEHRCPRCRKKMRPLEDGERIRCPDCRGRMAADMRTEMMID